MFLSLVVLFDLHLWVSLKGYGNAKKRKELMKEISNITLQGENSWLWLAVTPRSWPPIRYSNKHMILPSEKSYALIGFFY